MPGRSPHSFLPCAGPRRPSRSLRPRPALRAAVAPCGIRSPISRLALPQALHRETDNKRRYRRVADRVADAREFFGPLRRSWPQAARLLAKLRRCFGTRAGLRAHPPLDRSFAVSTRPFEKTCFGQTWRVPPFRTMEVGWIPRSYLSKRGREWRAPANLGDEVDGRRHTRRWRRNGAVRAASARAPREGDAGPARSQQDHSSRIVADGESDR